MIVRERAFGERALLDRASDIAVAKREAFDTVDIFGMQIDVATMQDAVSHISDCVDRRQGGWLLTPNVDILQRWKRNSDFRHKTSGVTLCVADGMPLVWASRLQGSPLPERVNGSNLAKNVVVEAARRGHSVFLLGGAPGVAIEARRRLQDSYPALRIAGTYCPPFGFEKDPGSIERIREALEKAQPDIVVAGLSSPKQEWMIEQCRDHFPHTWWLGVGCTLNFFSGHVKRAPAWMQANGLEWLYRLLQEPRYLARRYLVNNLPFCGAMLMGALWRRVRRTNSMTTTINRGRI